jgi:hypothetical protein
MKSWAWEVEEQHTPGERNKKIYQEAKDTQEA